jgi:hypothetical protein
MTDEGVGADFAHPARVYDYWLGGTDNFAADRAAADQVTRFMPEILNTESSGVVLIPRGRDAVLQMFNGRKLVEPGLVLVSYWRPEGGAPGPDADQAWAYGGVAAV